VVNGNQNKTQGELTNMEGLKYIADIMALAARTAPKSAGQDFIVTEILAGEAIEKLGRAMVEYGLRTGKHNFDRDGDSVLHSQAVVLIGLKDADTLDLNCGACGEEVCLQPNTYEGEFKGPNCSLRFLDMGIAIGSAVKMAGLMNADNRIMYRAGVVAREMGLIDADFVMGVPLSATGKNIFFDR
jgi:uncharacterized ferredoxin-like protein